MYIAFIFLTIINPLVFSTRKIVKTWLPNRLGDQILIDCLVIYIEKDIFNCIDNATIIHCLQNMKTRRGQLWICFCWYHVVLVYIRDFFLKQLYNFDFIWSLIFNVSFAPSPAFSSCLWFLAPPLPFSLSAFILF